MLKIKQISDLHNLPISNTILNEIHHSLLQPFSSEQEANDTWAELNCQLWFIENLDQIPDDVDDKDLLIYSLENIEHEEYIGDEYWLVLSIVGQDGQGLYILFNQFIKAGLLATLGVSYEQD